MPTAYCTETSKAWFRARKKDRIGGHSVSRNRPKPKASSCRPKAKQSEPQQPETKTTTEPKSNEDPGNDAGANEDRTVADPQARANGRHAEGGAIQKKHQKRRSDELSWELFRYDIKLIVDQLERAAEGRFRELIDAVNALGKRNIDRKSAAAFCGLLNDDRAEIRQAATRIMYELGAGAGKSLGAGGAFSAVCLSGAQRSGPRSPQADGAISTMVHSAEPSAASSSV